MDSTPQLAVSGSNPELRKICKIISHSKTRKKFFWGKQ